jgi:hypothetical protein
MDSVEVCECGVTWHYNDDPTTAVRCQSCRRLRPSGKCSVGSYEGHRAGTEGCRSVDERHLRRFIQEPYDLRALEMAAEMTFLRKG